MSTNFYIRSICLITVSLLFFECTAQRIADAEIERIAYKSASDTTLYLHRIPSKEIENESKRSAIIFFFGGGWKGGSVDQFRPHAAYFSKLGVDCFLADYRVENRHGTTPFDAFEDAKSAIRFLRKQAALWQIDPDKIIAAGGSAGGHLAAAAGTIAEGSSGSRIDKISSRPNALVLFNPVYDNGPQGYGHDRVGDRYLEISPLHNITASAPPTVVFFGTEDPLVPVQTSLEYQRRMKEFDVQCDLHLYEDQKHGFFNFSHSKYYHETVYQTHLFLHKLGYVANPPAATDLQLSMEKTHAHNDYRHPRALLDAVEQGFVSVEADILHQGEELFIGHDREELDAGDLSTLEELYLRPLFRKFIAQGSVDSTRKNSKPFYLWIDIKYNATTVYALLNQKIQPYIEMLSRREDGHVKEGAVTIILSGDRPVELVQKDKLQYFFLDGRSANINGSIPPDLMPFISENIATVLGGGLSGDTLSTDEELILQNFIRRSHDGGFQVRFWNTPDQPYFWKKLLELDVDLINTDNLKGLRDFLVSQALK